MINTPSIEEARRLIKKTETLKIVLAQNDEFNRKMLEYGHFDILLSSEAGNRKNKVRQTDSGLNHVLTKIAAKNKIAIGINLEELKTREPKEKAQRLARIKQNIQLCRKAKTRLAVKTKHLHDAQDILQSLGAATQQTKETIVF